MENEREKKEKLAAARRKLNEYKLNRSSGKAATPSVSSKPADVPLFYQNINTTTPTSFNIFNPAAAAATNNNNVSFENSIFTPSPSAPPPSTGQVSQAEVTANENSPQLNLETSATFSPTGMLLQQQQTSPVPEGSPPNLVPEHNIYEPVPITPLVMQAPSTVSNNEPAGEAPISNPFAMPVPIQDLPVKVEEPTLVTAFSNPVEDASLQPTFFTPQQHSDLLPSQPQASSVFTTSDTSFVDFARNQQANSSGILTDPIPVSVNTSLLPSAPPIDTATNVTSEVLAPKDNQQQEICVESRTLASCENLASLDHEVQQAFGNESDANMFASTLFAASSSSSTATNDIFNLANNGPFEIVPPLAPPVEPAHETQDPSSAVPTSGIPQTIEGVVETEKSKERMSPGILNPLTTAPLIESTDQGLPVFEVIEKSDLRSTPQNDIENQQGAPEVDIAASEVKPHPQPVDHVFGASESFQNQPPVHRMFGDAEIVKTESDDLSNQGQQDHVFQESASQTPADRSGEALEQMKSVQDALELQIEELRRENSYLLNRQTELTLKIEDSERLAHEFKLEKDRVKEESQTTSQALRAKINSLCEENQRIVKNSTQVGIDLRAKLEEKTKQLEEIQKAAIILSQSKMDFASKLDHEGERVKELQKIIKERDEEIIKLRASNADLQEKLKQEQQNDAVIHQLQDQARHYQVQTETLHKELASLRKKLRVLQSPPVSPAQSPIDQGEFPIVHSESQTHSDHLEQSPDKQEATSSANIHEHDHNHTHDHPSAGENLEADHHHHNDSCEHGHDEKSHAHHHPHHNHDHGDGDHHDHHHHHDHGDHHDHDHHHSHDHDHPEETPGVVARLGPSDELTELKKTLHRLQWENSTYKNDIEILAEDAKQKRTYEEKCTALEEENEQLKKEVLQLEHVIIQLQGENDTIGDYISLYQSQKLALRECAKEKDAQLELLAREREMLLQRLADLTALVQDLKDSKSEQGSQCADDHIVDFAPPEAVPRSKRQIEGKIRDLISEISSSTLIENFHPCAVCSGRLMTV